MFKITTKEYLKADFDKFVGEYSFPCTYILEDGENAYIGATGNIKKRTRQHKRDLKKLNYNFKNIHIIDGIKSNHSSAYHYEALLIKSMRIDKKFNILNRNDGIGIYGYYNQHEYEIDFDKLWLQLHTKDLVNEKHFQQIFNQSIYKFSPDTTLNKEQVKTLKNIIRILESGELEAPERERNDRSIIVSGEAGTGKTLVAVTLFYHLKTSIISRDRSIALVIACTSLRDILKKVFSTIEGLDHEDVIAPIDIGKRLKESKKEFFDILICDETHKLRRNKNQNYYTKIFNEECSRLKLDKDKNDELDWILQQSKHSVLFYDENQCAGPFDLNHNYFIERLPKKITNEKQSANFHSFQRFAELKAQMRIRAGKDYLKYIDKVFTQKVSASLTFSNYDFQIIASFDNFIKIIEEKDNKHRLCRICSGYGWKFISKNNKELYDITIENIDIRWNSKTKGWLFDEKLKNEMGSIYTLQGLDLNYAGVVIGPELYFDKSTNKIEVNRNCFFDKKVKNGVYNDTELKKYIINTYKVLLTRGILGTYVYVCDKNLREYLKSFICHVN